MASLTEGDQIGKHMSGPIARATSLCFNSKQRDLIAACDQAGRVFIWKMGWALSNRKQSEQSVLDHLGSVATDDEVGLDGGILDGGEDVE